MLALCLMTIRDEDERNRFELIYRENFSLMYHIALQILGQPQEAENAVHDAFVSLAEHYEKYQTLSAEKMTGLAVTIVKNRSLNILREQKHLSGQELETLVIPSPFVKDDPEWMAECNEQELEAMRLLSALPEISYEILILRYYYGHRRGDIAKILDIPVRTVDKRIRMAQLKIREMMRDEE